MRGGFGGRPPIGPRLAVSRTETANEGANDDDEDATLRTTTKTKTRRAEKNRRAERERSPRSRTRRFRSRGSSLPGRSCRTVVFASRTTRAKRVGGKTKTGSFVTDRSGPCLEVRGARARLAARAPRGRRAREKRVVDVGGAGHFPLGRKRDGPPDARGWARMGLVRVRRARSDRSSQSQSVGPQFDDDSHRSRDEKNDEGDGSGRDGRGARDSEGDFTEGVFTGEDEDRIEDVSAEYDFPSPAPSAAAAFIGLSRTSPASAYSAYSAYSENGSAPPTPPQFALKGGLLRARARSSRAPPSRSAAAGTFVRSPTLETPETHAADSGRGRSALASRRADRARRRSPSAPLFGARAVERSGSARIRARIDGLGGGLRGGLRGGFFRRI